MNRNTWIIIIVAVIVIIGLIWIFNRDTPTPETTAPAVSEASSSQAPVVSAIESVASSAASEAASALESVASEAASVMSEAASALSEATTPSAPPPADETPAAPAP